MENECITKNYNALFRQYYPGLLFYANRLLWDNEAEDVVQEVFLELWSRHDLLLSTESIQAYLYRMVYTKSINILKHRKVEEDYNAFSEEINKIRMEYYHPDHTEVIRRMENKELQEEINRCIDDLPEKRKEIFKLSYLHGMKNKHIAELMGVSIRTVEAQMYKALKTLREQLKHHTLLIFLFLLNKYL